MNIKFSDLNKLYESQRKEIDVAVQSVLDKGDFILGESVSLLENQFAEYCGMKYCATVDNGTNAIEFALRTVADYRMQEIVIPANTFCASVIGAINAGLQVRLVDVDYDTMHTTGDLVDALGGSKDIIMPVTLFGRNIDTYIFQWAENMDRVCIIDNCQGHGLVGLEKYTSCYSFYPAKNLSCCGDGGAICTNSKEEYNKVLSMRNYGSPQKYIHDTWGKNARLDTIQASILNVRLKKLDEWNEKRLNASKLYSEILNGVGDVITPDEGKNGHVWHLYVIKTKYRNELQEFLKKNNIPTQVHYPIPVHKQKAFSGYDFGSNNSFPVTEKLSEEILSLPMHPFLTEGEIIYVCDKIKEFYR